MKTKNILLFALLVLTPRLFAQDNGKMASVPRPYIAFSLGAAIPTGDFASTETGTLNHWNNRAGFGKTGISGGFEAAYYFMPHIGVVGSLGFASHGRLSAGDAKTLGDSYTDAFAVDESTVKTTGSYSTLTLLAGPQFSFPCHKLTFDIRAMGGWLKSLSTPQVTVLLEDQTDATFRQEKSTASAFGWQVGAGLRYAMTEKLGLMLHADYFDSDGIRIDNANRSNNAGRLVTKQPMSWVNVGIGITYTL